MATVLGLLVPGGRLFQTSEGHAVLARDLLDLRQQIVDRLVTLGGDADPLSVGEQMDDEAGPGPSLSCARRALDEEVASVERERQRLHAVEVGRLKPGADGEAPDLGMLPPKD